MNNSEKTSLEAFSSRRDYYLDYENEKEFIKQCRCDFFISTGRGGQKRNKTASATRITHTPSGLSGVADDRRSQAENRVIALRRLKFKIALNIHIECKETWSGPYKVNPRNAIYPLFIAKIFDCLHQCNYSVKEAGILFGVSTAKFVKILAKSNNIWQEVNSRRIERNLKQLKQ